MLDAGTAVKLQILLDLGAPARLSRLVDGKLNSPVAALNHFGHQSCVLGADVLIVEMDQLGKAHDMLIKADPIVHLAFFDITDDVIDRFEANRIECPGTVAVRIERLVARREDAVIAVAVDEGVRRVAIGLDGSQLVDTSFILQERGRRLFVQTQVNSDPTIVPPFTKQLDHIF